MFYKIIINNTPMLFNLSIVKRITLDKNIIYLYYHYARVNGSTLVFDTIFDEEGSTIKFQDEKTAKATFEDIEKLLQ